MELCAKLIRKDVKTHIIKQPLAGRDRPFTQPQIDSHRGREKREGSIKAQYKSRSEREVVKGGRRE